MDIVQRAGRYSWRTASQEQQVHTDTERSEPGSEEPEDPVQPILTILKKLFIQGIIEDKQEQDGEE